MCHANDMMMTLSVSWVVTAISLGYSSPWLCHFERLSEWSYTSPSTTSTRAITPNSRYMCETPNLPSLARCPVSNNAALRLFCSSGLLQTTATQHQIKRVDLIVSRAVEDNDSLIILHDSKSNLKVLNAAFKEHHNEIFEMWLSGWSLICDFCCRAFLSWVCAWSSWYDVFDFQCSLTLQALKLNAGYCTRLDTTAVFHMKAGTRHLEIFCTREAHPTVDRIQSTPFCR